MASLEAEVAKWRATARTVWRVECPKVANATVSFAEAVKSNHQLLSKVGSVLASLDSDELFECCKDLKKKKKKDLVGKVEGIVVEKNELAKMVGDLEAKLKELESRLEEFELRATRKREAKKELLQKGGRGVTQKRLLQGH